MLVDKIPFKELTLLESFQNTHQIPNIVSGDILLYKGDIELLDNEKNIKCAGIVTYRWLPEVRIEVKLYHSNKMFASGDSIRINGKVTPFRITRSSIDDCSGIIPYFQDGIIDSIIDSLSFEIPNFIPLTYSEDLDASPTKANRYIIRFETKKFTIEIKHDLPRPFHYSSSDGGFVLHARGMVKFNQKIKGFKGAFLFRLFYIVVFQSA